MFRSLITFLLLTLSTNVSANEYECDDWGNSCYEATYKLYLRCEIQETHVRDKTKLKPKEIVTVLARDQTNTKLIGKYEKLARDHSVVWIGEPGNEHLVYETDMVDNSNERSYRFVKVDADLNISTILVISKYTGVLSWQKKWYPDGNGFQRFSGTCEKADEPRF